MDKDVLFEKESDGSYVLRLQGQLDRVQVGRIWRRMEPSLKVPGLKRLIVDFRNVTGMDTSGVVLAQKLERVCRQREIDLVLRDMPSVVEEFLSYARERSPERKEIQQPPSEGLIARLGSWGIARRDDIISIVEFVGDFAFGCLMTLRRPHRFNFGSFMNQLQLVGWDAVPIVCGLSALMGMIIVFQGMGSSHGFNLNAFMPDMVVISVTREMAPLITAVILAGRSGAAFAAEIGSMVINDEIEALTVMDFDITRYLVLPRVFALMAAGPLLTILADAAGIIGGLVTSMFAIGIAPAAFINEVQGSLSTADIYTGLIKGLVFAWLLGLAGCYCGLRASMSSSSVGAQTTTSVVAGILLVILADGVLAAIFKTYGI